MKNFITTLCLLSFYFIQAQDFSANYDGGTNHTAVDVIEDKTSGEVFTVGTYMVSTNKNVAIIHYNEELTQQWVRTFNSTNSDVPVGIQIDNSNNVYVAINDGTNAHLITYNENGTADNTFEYNNVSLKDFYVDPSGSHAYLIGRRSDGDAFLARITNPVGTSSAWDIAANVGSSGGGSFEDIVVTSDGIFTVGFSDIPSGERPFIACYNTSGTQLDFEFLDTSGGFDPSKGIKIVTNESNSHYSTVTNAQNNADDFEIESFLFGSNSFTKLFGTATIFDPNSEIKHVEYVGSKIVVLTTNKLFVAHISSFVSNAIITVLGNTSHGLNDISEFDTDQEDDIYIGYGDTFLGFKKFDFFGNELKGETSNATNADDNKGIFVNYGDAPILIGPENGSALHTTQFCFPPRIQFSEGSTFNSTRNVYEPCPDESVTITASVPSGTTVTWDAAPGISDVNALSQTLTSGTYIVRALKNGCENVRSVVIDETSDLPSKSIVADGTTFNEDGTLSFEGNFSIQLRGTEIAGGSILEFAYEWFKDSKSNSLGLTFDDGPIVVNAPGTYFAELTWVGDGVTPTYADCSHQNTYSVVIEEVPVITFDPIPAKQFDDPDFTLNASASNSAPIQYSSSNTSVATISGSTVTITGVGTATITATAEAFGGLGSNEKEQTLTVNKADQTITFDPPADATFTDDPFDLTATSSGGLNVSYSSSNTSVAIVIGSEVTVQGVGTTTITASQNGNLNYNAASDVQQTLTVQKGDQTITFPSVGAKNVNSGDFTVNAFATSGLPVSFVSSDENVISISGTTASIVGAGTTTITAQQTGNVNYNAAPDLPQLVTVDKLTQSVYGPDISDRQFGVGAVNVFFSAPNPSGLPVSIESSDESVISFSNLIFQGGGLYRVTVHTNGAGTATITTTQQGDDTYAEGQDVEIVNVSKADQSISFGSLSDKIFGDSPLSLTGSANSGLSVNYSSSDESVATISGSTLTIVGAGTADITASQPGDQNYNAASDVIQSLTVDKASQSISFGSLADVQFGDSDFDLPASASSGLSVNYSSSDPGVATVSGSTVTIVGIGTTTITASQPGDQNYESASDVQQDLTVNKGDQTISFAPIGDKTFGDGTFDLTASSSSGLTVNYSSSNTAVATVSGSTVTIVGAGTTTFTASQAGNSSYNAASDVQQDLTVNKAAQTITFGTLTNKVFGDSDFSLSASSTSGLTVSYASSNESVATVSGNTVSIIGAGSADITASQAGNANYEAATDVPQTLTVDKVDQVVTFDPIADVDISVGTVELNASSDAGLTVAFSVLSGPANVSGTTVTLTGTGTITIEALQAGTTNYNPASAQQSFVVTDASKSTQTITFAPLSNRTFGDAPFNLTATASSGLNVSYTSSDETVATISGDNVTITGAGTTTITANQGGDDEFEAASSVSQVLTVNKADQVISFDLGADAFKVFGDASFVAGASSSSGLLVDLSSSNPAVASTDDGNIEINGAGVVTITASQGGNANYNAAETVERTLTVNKADQTVIFDPPTISDQPFSAGSVTLDIYGDPNSEGALSAIIKSGPATMVDIGPDFYEVTFTGFGEVVIEVTIQETDNYASSTGELSFTVIDDSKQNQSITFNALDEKTFGDDPFSLAATATSGLSVTYTSSDESVATISGSEVTIVGAGSTTITASQEGNGDFFQAEEVDQVLTVNQASQTISFDALSDMGINETVTLSATASSGLAVSFEVSGPASLEGVELTATGSGTVTVTASQEGNNNYQPAEDIVHIFEVLEEALHVESNEINIFPNPISDRLFINSPSPVGVKIFSLGGRVIYSESNINESVNLAQLKSGIYMLEISWQGRIKRMRIQKIN